MTQNEQEEETACLTHPVTKQGHQGREGIGCADERVDLCLRALAALPDLPQGDSG